jgi:hypothetical protein
VPWGLNLSATFRRFSGARRIRAVVDRVEGCAPGQKAGGAPASQAPGNARVPVAEMPSGNLGHVVASAQLQATEP